MGRKKRNRFSLVPTIRGRLTLWEEGKVLDLWVEALENSSLPALKELDPLDLAKMNCIRAKRFAGEGNFSKAVSSLLSLGIALPSDASIASMLEKHPRSESPPIVPNLSACSPVHLTREVVRKSATSFPTGSAPGALGFRPQYLYDLLRSSNPSISDNFLSALTGFSNMLVQGKAPRSVAPFLCSAPLIALKKPVSGLRPIAVGETLRRLVGKCVCLVHRLSIIFCTFTSGGRYTGWGGGYGPFV